MHACSVFGSCQLSTMSSRAQGDSATTKKGDQSIKTDKFLVITVFMRGDGLPANYVLCRANYRLFSLTAVKSIQARKRRAKGKAVKRPPPLHDKAKTLEKRSVGAK